MQGIRELRLYDTDRAATDKLMSNLAGLALPGLRVVRCHSTAEAVQGADIVTTVTADKRNATILTPEMIAPGMHVNAVGGDCPGKTELHADILLRPDARVVVEFAPQSRIEGEIQQLPADFPVIELTEVVTTRKPGRANDREVTIFDSVGFALQDFSASALPAPAASAAARVARDHRSGPRPRRSEGPFLPGCTAVCGAYAPHAGRGVDCVTKSSGTILHGGSRSEGRGAGRSLAARRRAR